MGTTAPAPHLDKLHVVFGQVVSGKQVVLEIGALDTDKKDRPLQDARIVNCWELVRKVKEGDGKKKKKKKKAEKAESSGSSGDSSNSSDSSSDEENRKAKKKAKKEAKKAAKKAKKLAKKSKGVPEEEDGELPDEEPSHPLVQVTKIDKDEIPEVPSNRFLDRGEGEIPRKSRDGRSRSRSRDRKRKSAPLERGSRDSERRSDRFSREGMKIKGRGGLTYRPVSRS